MVDIPVFSSEQSTRAYNRHVLRAFIGSLYVGACRLSVFFSVWVQTVVSVPPLHQLQILSHAQFGTLLYVTVRSHRTSNTSLHYRANVTVLAGTSNRAISYAAKCFHGDV